MALINNKHIPMPPQKPREFFLPLAFWTDILVSFDKRIEMICNGSGYGIVSIDIKIHNGKVHEVGVEEKTRIRGILEKSEPIKKTTSVDKS